MNRTRESGTYDPLPNLYSKYRNHFTDLQNFFLFIFKSDVFNKNFALKVFLNLISVLKKAQGKTDSLKQNIFISQRRQKMAFSFDELLEGRKD